MSLNVPTPFRTAASLQTLASSRPLTHAEDLFQQYWRPNPPEPTGQWNPATAAYEALAAASALRRASEGASFDPQFIGLCRSQARYAAQWLVDKALGLVMRF